MERKRLIALLVLCAGQLMMLFDATIINVALPSIQEDLDFSNGKVAWAVNAYLIGASGLLILGGRLGDIFGLRRMFIIGLTVFTISSLFCAISQSQMMLIGARFVQGVGCALTSSVVLSMIVLLFPEPKLRASALGIYGFVVSSGGATGLILGGVLTDVFNWHWAFLINIPIGIVTIFMSYKFIKNFEIRDVKLKADFLSVLILFVALIGVVSVILQLSDWGLTSQKTLFLGGVSVLFFVLFLIRQTIIKNALIPLSIFQSRNLCGANIIQFLLATGMFGMFFFVALYMQLVLGFEPLKVGLAFVPAALSMALSSLFLSSRIINRLGLTVAISLGLALTGGGLLLFGLRFEIGGYSTSVLPSLLLYGVGGGLAFPALSMLAISDVKASSTGLASGLLGTTYQVGGAIGLAILTVFSTTRYTEMTTQKLPDVMALNAGYKYAIFVGAIFVLSAIPVALLTRYFQNSNDADND